MLGIQRLLVAVFVLLLAVGLACDDGGPTTIHDSNRVLTETKFNNYLPYGERAPNPLPPNTRPEPYNPRKHGPPIPNQIPHLNLAKTPGVATHLDRRRPDGFGGPVPLGGFQKGLRFDSSTYIEYAGVHEAETGLVVPLSPGDSTVVFAPTALPAGSACVEVATTHRRFPQDSSATKHLAAWWDWCDPSGFPSEPEIEEDMTNSLWRSWYLRTDSNGRLAYSVEIIYDGSQGYPCWNGLIYNYEFGFWEAKLYSCHPNGQNSNWTGNGTEGWSIWEGHGPIDKSCPNMKGTAATELQVRDGSGSWSNINVVASSLTQGTMCWEPGATNWTMSYTQNASDSEWDARTPTS